MAGRRAPRVSTGPGSCELCNTMLYPEILNKRVVFMCRYCKDDESVVTSSTEQTTGCPTLTTSGASTDDDHPQVKPDPIADEASTSTDEPSAPNPEAASGSAEDGGGGAGSASGEDGGTSSASGEDGGDDDDEDADTDDQQERTPCPKCSNEETVFFRAMTEGPDIETPLFYVCTNPSCYHRWTK